MRSAATFSLIAASASSPAPPPAGSLAIDASSAAAASCSPRMAASTSLAMASSSIRLSAAANLSHTAPSWPNASPPGERADAIWVASVPLRIFKICSLVSNSLRLLLSWMA